MKRVLIGLTAICAAIAFTAVAPSSAHAQGLGDALGKIDGMTGADNASIVCDKRQKLTVDGKTRKAGNKLGAKKQNIVIHASGRCIITLKNVDITGVSPIHVSGSAKLTLIDSKVTASKAAIVAQGGAEVTIVNSKVDAKKLAVNVAGAAKVKADKKSKVKGRIVRGGAGKYYKAKK